MVLVLSGVSICVENSKLVFWETETSYGTAAITDGRNPSISFAIGPYSIKFAELQPASNVQTRQDEVQNSAMHTRLILCIII